MRTYFVCSWLVQEVPSEQPSEDVVGRPIPHLSAAKQATGEAIYCDDIPKYAGRLKLRENNGELFYKIVSLLIVSLSDSLCRCISLVLSFPHYKCSYRYMPVKSGFEI